jgi:hypothetical protein
MSLGAEILDKSVNHIVAQRPSRYHPGGLAHPCSMLAPTDKQTDEDVGSRVDTSPYRCDY